MALHTLDNEGNLGWTCPHCQKDNSAHISHEALQHTSESAVALPPCGCGSQTHVIVHPDMPNVAPGSIDTASRHMDLAMQLHAAGKGPETITRPEPEPMVPLSQVEEIVRKLLAQQRADDTAPRLKQVVARLSLALDPDGVAHWSCPGCNTAMAKSIRNSDFAWTGPDTIGIGACGACGNRPRLPASQYSDLSNALKDIGKVPQ